MARTTQGATAPSTAKKPTPVEVSGDRIRNLTDAINNMDSAAHHGLSEISAIARLTLAAMETPHPYTFPELIAQALRAIWEKADDIRGIIGCEAEDVGCENQDEASDRRLDAHCLPKRIEALPVAHAASEGGAA
ncbi:hypothetical protein [Pseudothauera rhizosphaerae]|uniref:Uncharacterized protein n=1 Tax=Pseudothauera rhizosphaerae TaxID=2565932 RepID=A0A4S4AW58_9RHOO|nr:hypothetical protein [Pseudothauera rhizosphaerae]THF64262.1 hypothetical protein E6O51_02785 [Pseudothauera rhizosphaerae]